MRQAIRDRARSALRTLLFTSGAMLGCTLAAAEAPAASPGTEAPAEPEDRLTYFESGDAFRTWVRERRRSHRNRYGLGGGTASGSLVAATGGAPATVSAPCTDPALCPEAAACAGDPACQAAAGHIEEALVVTAQRTATSAITNNQSANVDEGDVVKLIGHHLVVMHEGRLFVVDLIEAGARNNNAGAGDPEGTSRTPRLQLVHRANAYRDARDDAWYDEMVVHDRHVFVSRYSYDRGESSVEVFSLSGRGRLRREARYAIRSSDYFSFDNYALRIAGDRLLLYVPVPIDDVDPGSGVEAQLPALRIEARGRATSTRPLLPATRILRPSLEDEWMSLHVLVSCSVTALPDVDFRSEGVIGPAERELYVTAGHAYLWLSAEPQRQFHWREACPPGASAIAPQDPARVGHALAYRFEMGDRERSGGTAAARAFGSPGDQFALHESPDGLHALLSWSMSTCDMSRTAFHEPAPRLTHIPASVFATTLRPARMEDFRVLPGSQELEVQLTDTQVAYANSQHPPYLGRWSDPPRAVTATLFIVPFDAAAAHTTLQLPHGVDRLERVGNGLIAVGSTTEAGGLGISAVDLRTEPHVTTSFADAARGEAETRSHAFNARVDADGSGMFALPTDRSSRNWQAPRDTDLRFFQLDRAHGFSAAGALTSEERPTAIACEVSCIDWYGNARAVFIGDRVFALVGYELVEGALVNGTVVERQRLRLDAATTE